MVRIVKFVVYVVKTLDFNNIFLKDDRRLTTDDRCGDMKTRNNNDVANNAKHLTCKAPNNGVAQITHEVLITAKPPKHLYLRRQILFRWQVYQICWFFC